MKDILIPEGNEKELIARAEMLWFKELMLLYSLNKFDSIDLAKLQSETKVKLAKGILAEMKDIRGANKKGFTAVKIEGEIRNILENGPNLVFGCEEASEKDYLHHRGSGFNQVLAKIARDKDVVVGFSFSSVLRVEPILRSQIIGRMTQNKMLFRKYKVKFIVASFAERPEEMRAAEEMKAFGRVL